MDETSNASIAVDEQDESDQPSYHLMDEDSRSSVHVKWDNRLEVSSVDQSPMEDMERSETSSATPPPDAETSFYLPRKSNAHKHQLRDPCSCKRLKCFTKCSHEKRKSIWLNYWSLTYEAQQLFVATHMTECEVKQRRPRGDNSF